MEVKVYIRVIDKLKTTSAVKDHQLVTKLSFEAIVDPIQIANLHRMMVNKVPVEVVIGSPQGIWAELDAAAFDTPESQSDQERQETEAALGKARSEENTEAEAEIKTKKGRKYARAGDIR